MGIEKDIFQALVRMIEVGGAWAVAGIAVYWGFSLAKTAIIGWFIWSGVKHVCGAFKIMWK